MLFSISKNAASTAASRRASQLWYPSIHLARLHATATATSGNAASSINFSRGKSIKLRCVDVTRSLASDCDSMCSKILKASGMCIVSCRNSFSIFLSCVAAYIILRPNFVGVRKPRRPFRRGGEGWVTRLLRLPEFRRFAHQFGNRNRIDR